MLRQHPYFVSCLFGIQLSMALSVLLASALTVVADEISFAGPFGIAVKPDGSFYVSEIQGKRIAKFNAQGNFLGYITDVPGYGALQGPFDIDTAPSGNFYIADTLGHTILVLDPQERLLLKLGAGQPAATSGDFHEPHFLTVDEQRHRIYIADTHNQRVQIFNTEGNLLATVGKAGLWNQPGTFDFAVGIDTDDQGRIYTMSLYSAIINCWDADFNFLASFGKQGYQPGQFHAPYGLAIHNNTLWVADTRNSRLQKLTLDGSAINIIDHGEGAADNQFNNPTDIDFDAQGNIFVADWKNNRVVKLDPTGHFLEKWGHELAIPEYTPPLVYSHNSCRPPVELAVYGGLSQTAVDAAAANGVDWIYVSIGYDDQKNIINLPGQDWQIKKQVDYAHEKGIKVAAYVGIYHMGTHESQWHNQPQYFMLKKGSTQPDQLALSYYYPEIRRWKAQHIARQIKENNLDGLMLDYIRYPNNLYGYEPPLVNAFKEKTGKDAQTLAPDDPNWLQFRANYITLQVQEIRYELAQLEQPIVLSVYVGPDWRQDMRTVVRNWRDWVRMGLVDMICLGQYSRDFPSFYTSVRQAKKDLPEHIRVSIVLACWGGNLNNTELLAKGVQAALAAGPDEVAIYRGDAINLLKLWPAIGNLRRMTDTFNQTKPSAMPVMENSK